MATMTTTTKSSMYEQSRSHISFSVLVGAVCMGWPSSTMGYASQPYHQPAPYSVPVVHVWKTDTVNITSAASLPSSPFDVADSLDSQQKKQKHGWVYYDLGLGKNPPVVSKRSTQLQASNPPLMEDADQKHQFQVDSENPFPAPLTHDEAVAKEQGLPSSVPLPLTKTTTPFLKPQRQTSDILHIQDNSKYSPTYDPATSEAPTRSHLPQMAWTIPHDRAQVDVNTIWVEMLLYNQQQQQQQGWSAANTI